MRVVLIVPLIVGLLAVVACTQAPSSPPVPTVNVAATVSAAVQATVAAREATPRPVIEPVTLAELNDATARAQFLTARYGVPESEVASLTKATYSVAAKTQLTDAEQRVALESVVLDFAEHGGSGLRPYGIEGDNDTVARQLGIGSGNGLAALTPGEVVHARALIATVGLTKFVIGH